MKYVPFMICVIVFIFTSAGYFITDKKTEKIYGALSIVSMLDTCFVLCYLSKGADV